MDLQRQLDAYSTFRDYNLPLAKSCIETDVLLLRALANSNETSLRVYSTGDLPDVYEDSFMAVAKPDGETFQPTLILVGTRLGIDKINQVYWEALTATLQMPQSVGIAGYAHLSDFVCTCLHNLKADLGFRIEVVRPLHTTLLARNEQETTTSQALIYSTSIHTTLVLRYRSTRMLLNTAPKTLTRVILGDFADYTFVRWILAC